MKKCLLTKLNGTIEDSTLERMGFVKFLVPKTSSSVSVFFKTGNPEDIDGRYKVYISGANFSDGSNEKAVRDNVGDGYVYIIINAHPDTDAILSVPKYVAWEGDASPSDLFVPINYSSLDKYCQFKCIKFDSEEEILGIEGKELPNLNSINIVKINKGINGFTPSSLSVYKGLNKLNITGLNKTLGADAFYGRDITKDINAAPLMNDYRGLNSYLVKWPSATSVPSLHPMVGVWGTHSNLPTFGSDLENYLVNTSNCVCKDKITIYCSGELTEVGRQAIETIKSKASAAGKACKITINGTVM